MIPATWIGLVDLSGRALQGDRFHWFDEGAERSACSNYARPPIGAARAPKMMPCPRCIEALAARGGDAPPLVEGSSLLVMRLSEPKHEERKPCDVDPLQSARTSKRHSRKVTAQDSAYLHCARERCADDGGER